MTDIGALRRAADTASAAQAECPPVVRGCTAIPAAPDARADEVKAILSRFEPALSYLKSRRPAGGGVGAIHDEAKLQDCLYLYLLGVFDHVTYENPGPKAAQQYGVPDFLLPGWKVGVEAKYVRDAAHGRNIEQELNDDIAKFSVRDDCDGAVFVVLDPSRHMPDPANLRRHVEKPRVLGGKAFCARLVVMH